jgi:hypothetical protein
MLGERLPARACCRRAAAGSARVLIAAAGRSPGGLRAGLPAAVVSCFALVGLAVPALVIDRVGRHGRLALVVLSCRGGLRAAGRPASRLPRLVGGRVALGVGTLAVLNLLVDRSTRAPGGWSPASPGRSSTPSPIPRSPAWTRCCTSRPACAPRASTSRLARANRHGRSAAATLQLPG